MEDLTPGDEKCPVCKYYLFGYTAQRRHLHKELCAFGINTHQMAIDAREMLRPNDPRRYRVNGALLGGTPASLNDQPRREIRDGGAKFVNSDDSVTFPEEE